ncbi:hypothetical protein K7568_05595 [Stenotrophomonas maltophilia]|uniref:hypothetical protein n=1 Tax=Stenotrophomonas maltophilia TaxID=40324 RepID=UPI001D11BF18|nr:hypothetical protein [Stenotrophomonas maltophilia]UXB29287.1 hypothetical protein K7568_05595 [Stenotrophomonas maltophilia]
MSEPVVIALIGIAGAVIGSVATVVANLVSQWWQERAAAAREKPRKNLLLAMLNKPEYQWRSLDTLMHVIGSDEVTAKRLLLEVGARASEDGKRQWGLVSRNPLP